MMKALKNHNLREITPFLLLSLLLFASCTQLPVLDEVSETTVPDSVQESNDIVMAEPLPSINAAAESAQQTETAQQAEVLPVPVEEQVALLESLPAEVMNSPEAIETESEIEEIANEIAGTEMDAELSQQLRQETMVHQGNVAYLCEEIGNKLGSVSVEDCMLQNLEYAGAYSINERPLTLRDFEPNSVDEKSRILILGGIHGDEYSSISIMFKWMALLNQSGGG
jgi:hypothetical protein